MIKVYVDASINLEKELVGIGFIIYQNKKQYPVRIVKNGYVNNHEAEYIAVIEALNYLIQHNLQQETIFLYSDSKVVVTAIQRKRAKKEWQQKYIAQLLPLLEQFQLLFVEWYSDKENKSAHQLAVSACFLK